MHAGIFLIAAHWVYFNLCHGDLQHHKNRQLIYSVHSGNSVHNHNLEQIKKENTADGRKETVSVKEQRG